ncbi:MAG: hypothetical protein Kow0068_04480 [Marinilabiliales bacterium]
MLSSQSEPVNIKPIIDWALKYNYLTGNYDYDMQLLKNAEEIALINSDELLLGKIYYSIATINQSYNIYDITTENYVKAIYKFKEQENHQWYINSLKSISEFYELVLNYDSTMKYSNILNDFYSNNYKDSVYISQALIAKAYLIVNDTVSVQKYLDNIIQAENNCNDTLLKSDMLIYLADLYRAKKLYSKAIKSYNKAIEYLPGNKIGFVYYKLASLYIDLLDTVNAIHCYNEIIDKCTNQKRIFFKAYNALLKLNKQPDKDYPEVKKIVNSYIADSIGKIKEMFALYDKLNVEEQLMEYNKLQSYIKNVERNTNYNLQIVRQVLIYGTISVLLLILLMFLIFLNRRELLKRKKTKISEAVTYSNFLRNLIKEKQLLTKNNSITISRLVADKNKIQNHCKVQSVNLTKITNLLDIIKYKNEQINLRNKNLLHDNFVFTVPYSKKKEAFYKIWKSNRYLYQIILYASDLKFYEILAGSYINNVLYQSIIEEQDTVKIKEKLLNHFCKDSVFQDKISLLVCKIDRENKQVEYSLSLYSTFVISDKNILQVNHDIKTSFIEIEKTKYYDKKVYLLKNNDSASNSVKIRPEDRMFFIGNIDEPTLIRQNNVNKKYYSIFISMIAEYCQLQNNKDKSNLLEKMELHISSENCEYISDNYLVFGFSI